MISEDPKEATFSTTLFDSIEYQGFFWLQDDTEKRIPGIVQFSNSKIQLNLLGSFKETNLRDLAQVGPPSRFDVIKGISIKGTRLVLLQSTQVRSNYNLSKGTGSSTIISNYLIVGGHTSNEELTFTSMSINYTDLEHWVAYQPYDDDILSEDDTKPRTVKYTKPETEKYRVNAINSYVNIDSMMLSRGIPSFTDYSINHVAYISLEPDSKQNFSWFYKEMSTIRNLLALLAGHAIYPKKVVAYGDKIEEYGKNYFDNWHVFFDPGNETPAKHHTPHEMNTIFPYIKNNFQKILENWYAKKEALDPVVNLYSGVTYGAGLYLNFKFLAMIQALETYCRNTQPGKYVEEDKYNVIKHALINAIPGDTDRDLKRSLVDGKIEYGNEYSLRKRLKLLFKSLEPDTVVLITDKANQFAEEVTDTRNYLTHYSADSKVKALFGGHLYSAFVQLQALLTILLYKEIGIEETDIREILKQSRSRLAENIRMKYQFYSFTLAVN